MVLAETADIAEKQNVLNVDIANGVHVVRNGLTHVLLIQAMVTDLAAVEAMANVIRVVFRALANQIMTATVLHTKAEYC